MISFEELRQMGTILAFIDVPDRDEASDEFVKSVVGTPFDFSFDWDSDLYYCSKLVAKILDLKPQPMNFDSELWDKSYRQLNGRPGISEYSVWRRE